MWVKVLLVGLIIAFSANLLALTLPKPEPEEFRPIESTTIAVKTQVEDSKVIQVYERTPITLVVDTCTSSSFSEIVDLIFIRTDKDQGVLSVPAISGIGVDREKGCKLGEPIKLGLPSAVTEGLWVLQLRETVTRGGYIKTTNSTTFQIIAR